MAVVANIGQFRFFLARASHGTHFSYFHGRLAEERCRLLPDPETAEPGEEIQKVYYTEGEEIARLAWAAYLAGQVDLFQVRTAPKDFLGPEEQRPGAFTYIAIKRSKPHAKYD